MVARQRSRHLTGFHELSWAFMALTYGSAKGFHAIAMGFHGADCHMACHEPSMEYGRAMGGPMGLPLRAGTPNAIINPKPVAVYPS